MYRDIENIFLNYMGGVRRLFTQGGGVGKHIQKRVPVVCEWPLISITKNCPIAYIHKFARTKCLLPFVHYNKYPPAYFTHCFIVTSISTVYLI